MKYHIDKLNKNIIIDDEYLETLITKLHLTKEQAIQQYLEEEGIEYNEELEELDKKAKDSGISRTIHDARSEKPKATRRVVEKKPDLPKEELISNIAHFLENYVENVEITNKSKIITFKLGEDIFKLDLIRQRKPK